MRIFVTIRTAVILGVLAVSPAALAETVFTSPEAAATALVDAAKAPGSGKLDAIFGGAANALLSSGDADADARNLADFINLAGRGQSAVDGDGGRKVLVFGEGGWRFPIPLKAEGAGWTFDIAAGRQHVSDLTIGENELVAIGACADFVAAQNEYFQALHDDQPVQQFARRLVSTPGRHDGLYWEPSSPSDRSPLGDRIVAAAVAASDDPAAPRSYHGYRFKILTRQGAAAPGGAYDYLVGGRMLAGYAMLAWPADWGESGIMTFFCDQRGTVYERNLGPTTREVALALRTFNPSPSWQVVSP
ncbi:Protein of unknown function [Kaistia soli DSM 19436]|uniref:DUF2950 domain-containing protein n=1 Tax=Kaistia soli DSM 19436 TaxID=1122133 RepID=A0A1M4VB36_9HYPH|nr:DUF2950 family protein [Kaistia soli]SHE66152.1 Protein of unknown function [Kaistia soli DSM 19436]